MEITMNRTNRSDMDLLLSLESEYGRTFDVGRSPKIDDLQPALRRMLRAGYIARVSRGVYTILERPELLSEDSLLLATAPYADMPHYVSWRAALSRHELTEQDPLAVSVAIRNRRERRRIGDLRVRPVFQSAERFYGFKKMTTPSGSAVSIATPEKAIIDSLDRPDLAGGLPEVVKALGRRWAYDPAKLVSLAMRFPSHATAARLGYLMSALEVGDPRPLGARVRRKSAPVLLDVVEQEGPISIDQTWRVTDNVGIETLRAWASR
jgi:predicted transcriptional regulator of viral defense system